MRAWLAVVVASGCSFKPAPATTTAIDAALGGEGPPADRPSDVPVTSCAIQTDDSQLDSSGQVGASGGSPNPGMQIECDRPSDVVVGISLKISNAVIMYGGQSALAIDITCAPVTIRSDGTATVGASYTHEATGDGMQSWSPATATSVAMCPPDAVVSGLDTHVGSGNLFQNSTIRCAKLGANGAPTGATTAVYITGSLTEPNGDSQATCMTGHILRRLDPRTGSGLDAVTLRCAPSRCA